MCCRHSEIHASGQTDGLRALHARGGRVEMGYDCECGVTLLGKCALVMKRVADGLAAHAKALANGKSSGGAGNQGTQVTRASLPQRY